MTTNKFWKQKKLSAFTAEEWESVCTHCGRCCLLKLQDEDDDEVYYTDVVCRYHDCRTHLCREYKNRCLLVPECLKLTPENLGNITWIPKLCAYHILHQTGDLPSWHPLVSGRPLPDQYKISPDVVSEPDIPEEELEDHIIEEDDND